MIGLGSNRLSVCRRGGMSVTQAGRGGMEWLAGGRGPSWASPYSAQATAALKDAFSAAQWEIIKAYGFAHPEIVPYVNAYCPTYPFAVLEFAQIGRCIVTGNGECYFDLGVTTVQAQRIEVNAFFNNQNRSFIGGRVAYNDSSYQIGWDPTSHIMYDLGNGRTTNIDATMNVWHNLALDKQTKKCYLDGVHVATRDNNTVTTARNLYMLAINNNGSPAYWAGTGCTVSSAKILEGTTEHWYIPVENNKILDAATGNVINKSGNGTATFSYEFTPAS